MLNESCFRLVVVVAVTLPADLRWRFDWVATEFRSFWKRWPWMMEKASSPGCVSIRSGAAVVRRWRRHRQQRRLKHYMPASGSRDRPVLWIHPFQSQRTPTSASRPTSLSASNQFLSPVGHHQGFKTEFSQLGGKSQMFEGIFNLYIGDWRLAPWRTPRLTSW